MQISDNTILITGGGTGIGRALAEAFHARGNRIIVTGRRREMLQQTLDANPGMDAIELDIRDAADIRRVAGELRQSHPTLNAVIHNAGIMRTEDLQGGDTADAEDTIATNLLGPICLTAALMPLLLQQAQSTIVTVSSGLAFLPGAITPTYCATKAAIHSYSQSLRYQLRDTPVRVLEIVPPYVQTELTGPAHASDPNAMPLKAFVDEVMAIIEASPDAQEVCVDRVKPLRNAAAGGDYAAFFQRFNDARSGAAAAQWKGRSAP
ncbi:SDR family oxidoreductase [Hydrogenophaga sp.]|uniref:SDR family oxidoreductase n=1 Tax=Hydrogenophaga sp. TaxID=1904254 RepID=UPI0027267152|nr:SDR family NAD(P)-dependent oxidoreductase [Hydrogenophaga sp.]MDO9437630.1 SDR family NAD(P)-dependent oxidoreductase [Hydrogenophaga sp.]